MCIGKYNYPFFMAFLSTLTAMLMLITGACIAVVTEQSKNNAKITYYLLEILAGMMAAGFMLGLIRLLLYHLELTYTKLTTN